jgi:hypothetical protein
LAIFEVDPLTGDKYEKPKIVFFGCFCSWECANSFDNQYFRGRHRHLILRARRDIDGISIHCPLRTHPLPFVCTSYGGSVDIESYRHWWDCSYNHPASTSSPLNLSQPVIDYCIDSAVYHLVDRETVYMNTPLRDILPALQAQAPPFQSTPAAVKQNLQTLKQKHSTATTTAKAAASPASNSLKARAPSSTPRAFEVDRSPAARARIHQQRIDTAVRRDWTCAEGKALMQNLTQGVANDPCRSTENPIVKIETAESIQAEFATAVPPASTATRLLARVSTDNKYGRKALASSDKRTVSQTQKALQAIQDRQMSQSNTIPLTFQTKSSTQPKPLVDVSLSQHVSPTPSPLISTDTPPFSLSPVSRSSEFGSGDSSSSDSASDSSGESSSATEFDALTSPFSAYMHTHAVL